MLSPTNWRDKCVRQVKQSIATVIVLLSVAFVQSIARAVPTTYNGLNHYLFCWQRLALATTLMDFGSEALVLT